MTFMYNFKLMRYPYGFHLKKIEDDYSEPLLDFEHGVMLVDVEEINNGSSDDYVTVGNQIFGVL